jgi:hypothetical protein
LGNFFLRGFHILSVSKDKYRKHEGLIVPGSRCVSDGRFSIEKGRKNNELIK